MTRPVTSGAERLAALRADQESYPGHLLRRAQQVLTTAWAEEVSGAVTSSQFVILIVLRAAPGIDQRTLGEIVCMDRSTVATIVARLTAVGLIRQSRHPLDRRRKVLATTARGSRLAADLEPRAQAMSRRLLALLGTGAEQAQLMSDLRSLVHRWEDARRDMREEEARRGARPGIREAAGRGDRLRGAPPPPERSREDPISGSAEAVGRAVG
jgi:MarR family transcriptional regulator, temperature-dependent positive regulator of motility